MASKQALTQAQVDSYINVPEGIRPSHPYWNEKTLPADRLVYSFVNRNEQMDYQLDHDVLADDASAITIDNIFDAGILLCTPTAARSKAVPSAADFAAGVTSKYVTYQLDDSFDFTVINLTAATNAITLVPPAGLTAEGSMVIDAATSGTFRMRITNAAGTTGDIYRIA
tara:strand:- start:290 stop:796 length:507 start_codon:yes stop_codon:yes gene_type:complete